jgi:hypothetical protein
MYSPNNFANSAEEAGAISDGFRTTALPAAIAPTTGSRDNTEKIESDIIVLINRLSKKQKAENIISKTYKPGLVWINHIIKRLYIAQVFIMYVSCI